MHNQTMRNRRPLVSAVFIPILIGCIGLSQLASKPRFAEFHTVDILQLIASGMCFGAALVLLIVLARGGTISPN